MPKELDPNGKYKDMRVFRDREELTTKDLGASLDEALRESEYLIIVCSRRTPESIWCTEEVRKFKEFHRDDSRIIPVLIEGEPYESFNEELNNLKSVYVDDLGEEQVKELELLAADLRPEEVKNLDFIGYSDLEKNNKQKLESLKKESIKILKDSEIYRIMATILGVNFGDLKQRHKERRTKRLITAGAIIGAVLLVFGIAMTNLYFKAVNAERTATEQTTMMTLKAAYQANEEGNRIYSLLIAKEAMKNADPEMENYENLLANYNRILNDAIMTPQYSSEYVLNTGSETVFYSITDSSVNKLVTGGDTNNLLVVNMENGEILEDIQFESSVSAVDISEDGKDIYVATRDQKLYYLDGETYEKKLLIDDTGIVITQMGIFKNKYFVLFKISKEVDFYNLKDFSLISRDSLLNKKDSGTFTFVNVYDNGDYITVLSDGSITKKNVEDPSIFVEIEPASEENNYRQFGFSKETNLMAYSVEDPEDGLRNTVVLDTNTMEKRVIENVSGYFMKFGENNSKLYITSFSESIEVYNLEDLQYETSYRLDERIKAIEVDYKNNRIAAVAGDKNELYIIETDKEKDYRNKDYILVPDSASKEEIATIRFVDNGKKIITSAKDANIKIYSTESKLATKFLPGKIKAISSDNNVIFFIYDDYKIVTHHFDTGETIYVAEILDRFTGLLNNYAISNDGQKFAFTDPPLKNVNVFGSDGNSLYTTKEHELSGYQIVSDVEFSENSNEIFTLGEDGLVYISDMSNGDFKKELKDLDETADKMLISEDGSVMAIIYFSGKTSVFNVETGQVIERFEGNLFTIDGDKGDLISANGQYGKRLFSYKNGKTSFYASNSERGSSVLKRFSDDFVSKDGKYLLTTVSGDETILTDLDTGFRLRTLPTLGKNATKSVMNKESNKIAYEYSDDTIVLTDNLTTEELIKKSEEMIAGRKLTEVELQEIGLIGEVSDEE